MTAPKKLTLGAGQKFNAPAPAKMEPVESEVDALLERAAAPPVKAKAPMPTPKPATQSDWASEKKDFAGRKPSAVETITLRGVSPEKPVFNAYPFDELQAGRQVFLLRDPFGELVVKTKVAVAGQRTEAHGDGTAISVQDEPDGTGRHIGYIPKTLAATVTKGLDMGYEYEAEVSLVKGGFVGHNGEKLNHGVDILVKFYPPQP